MKSNTYEEFVEKFKPKRTTDDCYTPEVIYETVAGWVAEKYGLDRSTFVRPFWPGGDYESFDYPEGAVVVDNPPFSIFTQIVDFYAKRGIRFFLFAPSLTCISSEITTANACALPMGIGVTYANGANVNTGFVTNLEERDIVLKAEPELYRRLYEAETINRKDITKQVPKYTYPDYVITAAMVQRYARYGIDYELPRKSCTRIRALDSQRAAHKTVFGGGLLLSEKAAAIKGAAEKEADERAILAKIAEEKVRNDGATPWAVSDREREIVAGLV